jgi:hypothetical protein
MLANLFSGAAVVVALTGYVSKPSGLLGGEVPTLFRAS